MYRLGTQNSDKDRSTGGLSGVFHPPIIVRRVGAFFCIALAVAGTKTNEGVDSGPGSPGRNPGYRHNVLDAMKGSRKAGQWKEQCDVLKKNLAELQKEHEEIAGKLQQQEEQNTKNKEQYESVQSQLKSLQAEKTALQERLNREQHAGELETSSLKQQIERLTETIQDTQKKISQLRSQREKDKVKIAKVAGELVELRRQMEKNTIAEPKTDANEQYVGEIFENKSNVTISMDFVTECKGNDTGVTEVIEKHLATLPESMPGRPTPQVKQVDIAQSDAPIESGRVCFRMDDLSLRESMMVQREIDSRDFIDKLERHLEGNGHSVRVEQASCKIECCKREWYKNPLIIAHIAVGACILVLFFTVLCKQCGRRQDTQLRNERVSEIPDSDIEAPAKSQAYAPVLRSTHENLSLEEDPWDIARNRKKFLAETTKGGISPRKAKMVFKVIGELRHRARVRSMWPNPRVHKRGGRNQSRPRPRR